MPDIKEILDKNKTITIVEGFFGSLLTPIIAIVLFLSRISFISGISYLFFQLGVLFSKKAEIPSLASIAIIFFVII